MMTIAVLGIDLGKNVCGGLSGLDEMGKVVRRRRMTREGGRPSQGCSVLNTARLFRGTG